MRIIVIFGDRTPLSLEAASEAGNLWIDVADLKAASGWELKSEGVCKGELCVPIPLGRAADFLRADGRQLNLTGLANLLRQPVIANEQHGVWFIGEGAGARRETMASLQAPDFELPDLDGKLHRLSHYRGQKVLLSAWASW